MKHLKQFSVLWLMVMLSACTMFQDARPQNNAEAVADSYATIKALTSTANDRLAIGLQIIASQVASGSLNAEQAQMANERLTATAANWSMQLHRALLETQAAEQVLIAGGDPKNGLSLAHNILTALELELAK